MAYRMKLLEFQHVLERRAEGGRIIGQNIARIDNVDGRRLIQG